MPKEVKQAADYITENDNNHDGVAEIIHKFVLKIRYPDKYLCNPLKGDVPFTAHLPFSLSFPVL